MDQPPLLERQIETQKIEAFKQIHINLNILNLEQDLFII